MNLGDILVAKGLVTADDVKGALEHQRRNGGRFGESIVALGVMTKEQIDKVLEDAPQAPLTVLATGLDPAILLELALKGMFTENLETASQIAEALKVSSTIVNQLLTEAKERKLVEALSVASGGGAMAELRLSLTRAGREFAADALKRGQYFGPAPVSLKDYQQRILQQRVTNEIVSRQRLEEGFAGLVMTERFLNRLGPAINSGTAILIYGPAGNGKTTVAEIVGKIFQNVIYVPYCVDLDGEIMKVYDPAVHRRVPDTGEQLGVASVRRNRDRHAMGRLLPADGDYGRRTHDRNARSQIQLRRQVL